VTDRLRGAITAPAGGGADLDQRAAREFSHPLGAGDGGRINADFHRYRG
jgi:hypothetical protein